MFMVTDLFEIKFKKLYIKFDGKTEYGDSLGLLSCLSLPLSKIQIH